MQFQINLRYSFVLQIIVLCSLNSSWENLIKMHRNISSFNPNIRAGKPAILWYRKYERCKVFRELECHKLTAATSYSCASLCNHKLKLRVLFPVWTLMINLNRNYSLSIWKAKRRCWNELLTNCSWRGKYHKVRTSQTPYESKSVLWVVCWIYVFRFSLEIFFSLGHVKKTRGRCIAGSVKVNHSPALLDFLIHCNVSESSFLPCYSWLYLCAFWTRFV